MLIGDRWKIEADDLNVILYEKHPSGGLNRRTGKVTTKDNWVTHTYYSTVKNALKALIEQEVRNTQLKDLETIVEKIDRLYYLIDGLNLSQNT